MNPTTNGWYLLNFACMTHVLIRPHNRLPRQTSSLKVGPHNYVDDVWWTHKKTSRIGNSREKRCSFNMAAEENNTVTMEKKIHGDKFSGGGRYACGFSSPIVAGDISTMQNLAGRSYYDGKDSFYEKLNKLNESSGLSLVWASFLHFLLKVFYIMTLLYTFTNPSTTYLDPRPQTPV